MKQLPPNTRLIRSLCSLIEVVLLLPVISGEALSDPPDTLNLQLQWACPLAVVDLKLVDFDGDGISEILVGFNSDSSRAGILDAASQNMVWQSPGFGGSIYTVAAGDRNEDGFLDIVCGGQRSDTSIGYIEIFNGPNFDSVCTLSGFNDKVLSAAVSARGLDSLPQIFLGTYLFQSWSSEWGSLRRWSGGLYILDGKDLTTENVGGGGMVRRMLARDINGDTYEELLSGMHYIESLVSIDPTDYAYLRCFVNLTSSGYYHNFILYDIVWWPPAWVDFNALEVGCFNDGASYSIVASGHWGYHFTDFNAPRNKVACWNASTTELEWSMGWDTGSWVTDLAVCGFNSEETNAICAAYRNGLIEFKSGADGSNLAVVLLRHSIYHLELGNLDWDPWVEMCVASGDSLYVYKTELWPPNDPPVVSDILNQTIAEGESFASLSLDDYVTDPDDHDSVMVWSHWGETEVLVDITDRVATITLPNPEWNGVETIWFKACDPGGLCDSDEATFKVTAENDPPVVSDIPNQTIAEGESFASLSLDDYVTDPDDHDSVMVWSHWGETEVLVDITDRVATITLPNPEWNGVETIWFKACDPGGLCDSDEATFTLHPEDFCLFQNYPNPFNPQTNIRFDVPVASNVTVTIYNILGEKIRTFEKRYEPGTHTLRWDGKNSSGEEIASGVYLYKLSAGNHQETRKMVLIR